MEPKISRKKTKAASVLLWVAVAICIIALIAYSGSGKPYLLLVSLAFSFYTAYRTDEVCKCPHCGTRFRGIDGTKPNAGYCRKCGKLMEFDE